MLHSVSKIVIVEVFAAYCKIGENTLFFSRKIENTSLLCMQIVLLKKMFSGLASLFMNKQGVAPNMFGHKYGPLFVTRINCGLRSLWAAFLKRGN